MENEEIKKYIHLLNRNGFRGEVDYYRSQGKTLKDSYEEVEKILERVYCTRRYASFESFKRVYYNKIKKK